jgi:ribonuclease P protein component
MVQRLERGRIDRAGRVSRESGTVQRGASFRQAQRLKGRRAFSRVFGGRRSSADRLLVVYAMPNDLSWARLGLTVGRKHGMAVRRNRIKRLLREAFRLGLGELPRGYDFVCVPRVGSLGTLSEYRQALRALANRAAGLWQSRRDRTKDA